MSLRSKLLAAFLAVALLALIGALFVAQISVRAGARAKIEADLGPSADALRDRIDEATARLFLLANSASGLPLVHELLAAANTQDDELGLATESEDKAWERVREIGRSLDIGLLTGEESTREHTATTLLLNRRLQVVYNRADRGGGTVRAPFGQVVAVETALSGQRTSDFWAPAAIARAGFKVADPARDEDLLLVAAVPVRDPRQDVLGILIYGRWVSEILAQVNSQEQRSAAEPAGSAQELAVQDVDGVVSATGPAAGAAAHSLAAMEIGMVHALDLDGRDYLARGNPVVTVDGALVGRAFVFRDVDHEIKPILHRFQTILLLSTGPILAIAALAGFLLSRRIARPVATLSEAARKVRLGDLSVQVPAESADELGRLAGAFNEMVAGLKQRDEIKGLFKRYLSPAVVDELIRHPEKAAPGGERKILTVCFADLEGFTGFSERLDPEALVELLNGYFEEAAQVLGRHGATLDKFIGDAIMCFWNAPLPQTDHATRACLAALDLLEVVGGMSERLRQRALPALNLRIGINTGPCVAGNIGAKSAQDYTAMGDAVNLASRLEGAARVYRTRTLVTEATMIEASHAVRARELDLLRVKGRTAPVRVYELVNRIEVRPPPAVEGFAEALDAYRGRDFSRALSLFDRFPHDGPSAVFAERCRKFLETPPDEGWAGVHVLDAK